MSFRGGDMDYYEWLRLFFVRFRKTQGAKLKPFFKTQGSKLKVFPKNSMYRRFFNDFFKKKNHFVANFVCKTQKLCWKLLHFDVKSILWLRKINIYHLILPFLSKNLSIFPETQQFFKLKAKTQRKFKTQGKNSTILTKKLKVPEVFTTYAHGKIAQKKACSILF